MNVDKAIAILNEFCHIGFNDWTNGFGGVVPASEEVGADEDLYLLSSFEAGAVARECERLAGRDMPATRELINAIKASVRFHDKAGPEHMDSIQIGGRRIQPDTLRAIVAEWPDQPNPSTETDS